MASQPPSPKSPTTRTVAALTPEAKLWPAQSPLLEKLLQLVYGNEGLDYLAKKQLAEGPRETQPFSMSAELPGANPEAPTPGDAMVGLAMSGGGLPGSISRASAPQIEQRAMSERRPPKGLDPGLLSQILAEKGMARNRAQNDDLKFGYTETGGTRVPPGPRVTQRPADSQMPEKWMGEVQMAGPEGPIKLNIWRDPDGNLFAQIPQNRVIHQDPRDPTGRGTPGFADSWKTGSLGETMALKKQAIEAFQGAQKPPTPQSSPQGGGNAFQEHLREQELELRRKSEDNRTRQSNFNQRYPQPTPARPVGNSGIASPDLIAALMEATRATPETAPTARRPENNWQLGFPREGQSRPFAEQKYRFELPVRVTWPDGTSHTDVVKGLNASHALKRAQFNWEGAKIEPLTSRPEFVNNASAESGSGASAEALSRTSSMATRGQKFMIRDRAGNFRPATEDGAMSLRPGESFGIMGPFGFDVQSSKGDQPTVSPKMRARNTYSADGTGRHFTEKGLEDYRRDLSAQLRSEGKVKTAESYERMSIRAFAAQGGYVIVDK